MNELHGGVDGLSSTKRQLLEALARQTRPGRDGPVRAAGAGGPRPVSYGQRRLWFLHQLEPDSPLYNLPAAIALDGRLDASALRAALREVVHRHEILRTAFNEEDGEPVQVPVSRARFECPTIDVGALPAADADRALAAALAAEARRPFDLAAPPLVRAALIRLDAERNILLLTMHHIVSDGWSVGVLIREAVTLYSAFARGLPSPLPDLALQYADFAAWQRERLGGERLAPQLEHWKSELEGGPPPLDLPTDRPRSAIADAAERHRGSTHLFSLPDPLVARLRELAQRSNATLFMALLAAFETLLFRYTNRTDFNVGVPIAGRHVPGVDTLIGFFVNFLVLRSDVRARSSFADLLERVRRRTLDAYRNQDAPFELLVRELAPEREPGEMPFFNVIFDLNNTPADALRLPGLAAAPLHVDTGTAHADWVVNLFDDGQRVTGRFTYRRDLFDEATIRRTVERFVVLLDAAATMPDQPIARLPLLPTHERDTLARWSRRHGTIGNPVPVHARFASAARHEPDRIAAISEELHVSYAELDRRSRRLARRLASAGAGPGRLVGVLLDRSVEAVVAMLGALRCGAGYLPMDPASPTDRLRFMLRDADASVVVTRADVAAASMLDAITLVDVDSDGAGDRGGSRDPRHGAAADDGAGDGDARIDGAGNDDAGKDDAENDDAALDAAAIDPDAVAYLIYTSGSTGTPKGVAVTHRNVARLFDAADELFDFGPDDAWTLFHSTAFDFSVWEIWGALCRGGRLVVVPFLTSRSPDDLLALLERQRVTVLNQTPSAFRQLVAAERQRARPAAQALRYVVFGGEALDIGALRPWIERHGDERPRLVNMYGITETTVHVTHRRITRADLAQPASSRIGRALPDLDMAIVDPQGEPAPIGVPGEILVGGGGVARGYHGRPALTAERFLPSPHGDGERFYRSGDCARYVDGGDVEYLGRLDNQVKIRGFRIETGEIEAALKDAPGVRDALVVASPDADGEPRLVAYVVAASGDARGGQDAAPDPAALRRLLRRRLPEHMVPSAFVPLRELPITRNGKVDRKALPEPDATASEPDSRAAHAAPLSPTEQRLARIWEATLEQRGIGRDDDFFDLGGHSLLATRVVSRARRTFDVDFPLGALFRRPTLAAMAAEIDRLTRRPDEPPLVTTGRTDHVPLAFAQQRLWFLEQLEPGSPAYVIPAAVRLRGRLRRRALLRAFDDVVRRHGALRTSFEARGGRPEQRIHERVRLEVPTIDLSALRPELAAPTALRLIEQNAHLPFALDRPPLIRMQLLRLAVDEHFVLLQMHHIISDAWSIGLFVDEFAQAYAAHAGGELSNPPPLPIQYADHAIWQRDMMAGDALRKDAEHWRERLRGLPVLNLPTDRPRPARQTFDGAWRSRALGAAVSTAIRRLAGTRNATPFMVLLAAFDAVLTRRARQTDIVVGTDVAGRTRLETENLIGLFVNQLVLRVDTSGDPPFVDLLDRVRRVVIDAFEHQDLPFEKLVEALQPERDLSRNPLFQVMFILQNARPPTLRLPELELEQLDVEQRTAVFDISLIVTEAEDGFRVLCRYNTDLFDGRTIEGLLDDYERLLTRVTAEPATRIASVALDTASGTERAADSVQGRRSRNFSKLVALKPQGRGVAEDRLVRRDWIAGEKRAPLMLTPEAAGLDPTGWAAANRDAIGRWLDEQGALLFRGFDVPSLARFEALARAVSPELMGYGERSSPRHALEGMVFTSTDHPADQPIVLHNEQSYTLNWMMKLWFYCVTPPTARGRTPLADSRGILARLRPSTREAFETRGVMYMRNYGTGLGLTWREAFQTDDPAVVEKHCRDNRIDWEWIDEARLRTRQVRPAVREHPRTGERVWFNHALFFHISSLEPATRDAVSAGLAPEDLPFNTFYGDGAPFEDSVLDELRAAYAAETTLFDWRAGDVLLIDNMLVAHGREPFEGPRRIAVVMAEPISSIAANGTQECKRSTVPPP